jgi:large subunit ribosomal protein L29
MSSKHLQPLADMGTEDLKAHLEELRVELFNLRFRNQMRQLDNPLRIRRVRKQIARAMTLLAQRARPAGQEIRR